MLFYPILITFFTHNNQSGNSASGQSLLIVVYYGIIKNMWYLLNKILTLEQESPVSHFRCWETYFSRTCEMAGLIWCCDCNCQQKTGLPSPPCILSPSSPLYLNNIISCFKHDTASADPPLTSHTAVRLEDKYSSMWLKAPGNDPCWFTCLFSSTFSPSLQSHRYILYFLNDRKQHSDCYFLSVSPLFAT